jgi:toxin ParE1/3/4
LTESGRQMSHVLFDSAALADVDGIYDHIGRTLKSPQAADRTIDQIQRACDTHASQPLMGEARPDLGKDIRIFPVGSYVVLYRPMEDGIHVFRVLLGRRNYPSIFRESRG